MWSLAVTDIKAIGEFTTAAGPWLDDYFFVFVDRAASCLRAPLYAAGVDQALGGIGDALGCIIRPGLVNSTELRSRVIWPDSLVGVPLLELQPRQDKTLLGRVKATMGFEGANLRLAAQVRDHLQGDADGQHAV